MPHAHTDVTREDSCWKRSGTPQQGKRPFPPNPKTCSERQTVERQDGVMSSDGSPGRCWLAPDALSLPFRPCVPAGLATAAGHLCSSPALREACPARADTAQAPAPWVASARGCPHEGHRRRTPDSSGRGCAGRNIPDLRSPRGQGGGGEPPLLGTGCPVTGAYNPLSSDHCPCLTFGKHATLQDAARLSASTPLTSGPTAEPEHLKTDARGRCEASTRWK